MRKLDNIGISFKGGLARGFGSIGVVRWFQEQKICPKVIIGSSSGAFVGAMWAMNYDWEKMIKILANVDFLKLTSVKSLLFKGSCVDLGRYRKLMLAFHRDVRIENLDKKLIIIATDPLRKRRIFIEKGSLADAAIASSAFPLIFPIIRVNGRKLIDGDFVKNYSVDKLKELGVKIVIGVCHHESRQNLFIQAVEGVFAVNEGSEDELDLEINYDAGGMNHISFNKLPEIVDAAYQETCRLADKINNKI